MDLAYAKSYPLDRRFTVEFALDGSAFEARWSPFAPKGRKARSLLPAYRRARHDFLSSLDVNVTVIEL
ncbi:MAG: hypothetical protein AAGB23_07685 [Pseudomonadota bacterium]